MNTAGGSLWFCLVDGDRALDTEPVSLELRSGSQAGYAITAFRDECAQALAVLSPDRVVILDMEGSGQRRLKVADMRTRFTAETLLASCAVDAGIICVRLSRAKLRSLLGLPREGAVSDYAASVFDAPAGTYWTKKRDLAALAARAEIVGG